MNQTPLGLDDETWSRRHEVIKKTYNRNKSWRKGYESGKKGESKEDNPFTIPADVWELLKERTLWIIGWEEGFYARKRRKHKSHKDGSEQVHHIKELVKSERKKHHGSSKH